MKKSMFVNGRWLETEGQVFQSRNPADGSILWQGRAATASDVGRAVDAARQAFPRWNRMPYTQRVEYVERFRTIVEKNRDALAKTIAEETGKPLWDARGEVVAVLGKMAVSIQAYQTRTGEVTEEKGAFVTRLKHKAHGVMAVFGPYNFPCHLPNGHIMPALIAGNAVVFKPSELTPLCAELTLGYWAEAGLPEGVLNLVQGAKETGVALAANDGIDGILFTGSVNTGRALHEQFAGHPEKLLALEMGGNNPLIVDEVRSLQAAAHATIQSAFLSSGQRCTCARRLIVPDGEWGDAFIDYLVKLIPTIRVGAYNDLKEPYMGPLISKQAAERVLRQQDLLVEAGARALIPVKALSRGAPFVSPGLVDASRLSADHHDEEIFGPLLQLFRSRNFTHAIVLANQTRFGLAAGLISDNQEKFERFYAEIRAGIINWNRPLTGASSAMPFGGIGLSGNHRSSAYYAADYCAYPVASMLSATVEADASLLNRLDGAETA